MFFIQSGCLDFSSVFRWIQISGFFHLSGFIGLFDGFSFLTGCWIKNGSKKIWKLTDIGF